MKIKMLLHSLIFRSLILLVLFICLLLCGISLYFINTQKKSLGDSVFKKNYEEIVRLEESIGLKMDQFSSLLSLLAKTSSIIALDPTESSGFLKSFDVTSLFVSGESVFLYDRNQKLICDNSMLGTNLKDKKQFTDFDKVTPIRAYTTPWFWENDSPQKMFAYAVGSKATASGTIVASFSFRRIWQTYANYTIGEKGFLIATDLKGKILMHPDLQLATSGKHHISEFGISMPQKLSEKQALPLVIQNQNKQYLVTYAYNSKYQFALFSLQPIAEIESTLSTFRSGILLVFAIILPTTILIIILLFFHFATPLYRLISYINHVGEGHFNAKPFPITKRKDEVGSLATAFNKMLLLIQDQMKQLNDHQKYLEEQVQKRTLELENAKNQLEILSRTDELTKLPNRRDLMEKIQHESHRANRMHRNFCFIFIDIDKFKSINDTYGHHCGDVVLQTVANTIRQLLRKYDFVARWGGEEFLAVLPETEISGAIVVAERFRKSIESLQIDYKGVQIPVTITLGISQYDSELGVDKSIQLADQALYDGKMNGRNQVVINKKQNNKSEETIL